MLKRLLSIIVYIITIPPVILITFIVMVMMLIVSLFIYIVKGVNFEKTMEQVVDPPVFYVMDIPEKINNLIFKI